MTCFQGSTPEQRRPGLYGLTPLSIHYKILDWFVAAVCICCNQELIAMAAMALDSHIVGGDLMFCAIIVWLSIISFSIFSSVVVDGDHQASQSRMKSSSSSRESGALVFPVAGRQRGGGCKCGCCIGGAGVCGTYLS